MAFPHALFNLWFYYSVNWETIVIYSLVLTKEVACNFSLYVLLNILISLTSQPQPDPWMATVFVVNWSLKLSNEPKSLSMAANSSPRIAQRHPRKFIRYIQWLDVAFLWFLRIVLSADFCCAFRGDWFCEFLFKYNKVCHRKKSQTGRVHFQFNHMLSMVQY